MSSLATPQGFRVTVAVPPLRGGFLDVLVTNELVAIRLLGLERGRGESQR